MFVADVNECAVPDLQTEVCHYGCINTPGSYRCAEPQELKDQPIAVDLPNNCLPGYELSNDGSCLGESTEVSSIVLQTLFILSIDKIMYHSTFSSSK